MSKRSSFRRRPRVQECGEVLVLGCEGGGKTVLLRQLVRQASPDRPQAPLSTVTQPSVQVDIVTVLRLNQLSISLRELGGSMQPVWPRYYADCRAVIFVANVSSMGTVAGAVVELYNLLSAPQLQAKPFLLLFNKHEHAQNVPAPTLNHLFRLSELRRTVGDRVTTSTINIVSGSGLSSVIDWLEHNLPPLPS